MKVLLNCIARMSNSIGRIRSHTTIFIISLYIHDMRSLAADL